jgi:hypothetical protein
VLLFYRSLPTKRNGSDAFSATGGTCRGINADPASIGVLSTGEARAVALLLVRSIYPTAAITRSTFLIRLARMGKMRRVISTAAVGGNDRARPQKIEQEVQERISGLAARNGRALRSGHSTATKLTVGIVPAEDEATDLRRWFSKEQTDNAVQGMRRLCVRGGKAGG